MLRSIHIDQYANPCYFILSYSGNINLQKGDKRGSHINIIIGSSVGAAVLLLATIASCLFMSKGKKKYFEQGMSLAQSLSSSLAFIKITVGSTKLVLICFRPT
jgi:hypothetical protein